MRRDAGQAGEQRSCALRGSSPLTLRRSRRPLPSPKATASREPAARSPDSASSSAAPWLSISSSRIDALGSSSSSTATSSRWISAGVMPRTDKRWIGTTKRSWPSASRGAVFASDRVPTIASLGSCGLPLMPSRASSAALCASKCCASGSPSWTPSRASAARASADSGTRPANSNVASAASIALRPSCKRPWRHNNQPFQRRKCAFAHAEGATSNMRSARANACSACSTVPSTMRADRCMSRALRVTKAQLTPSSARRSARSKASSAS